MKSQKLLQDFTEYCKENQELRFWQALRAFAGVNILATRNGVANLENITNIQDTFYWENKNN